jgi:hypothetical protein
MTGYCDCEVFGESDESEKEVLRDFEKAKSQVGQVIGDAIRDGWDMKSCLRAFETPNRAVIVHRHSRKDRIAHSRAVETCLYYARAVLGIEDGVNSEGNEYWEIFS